MEVEVLDNFFAKDTMEVPSSTVEKTSQVLVWKCSVVAEIRNWLLRILGPVKDHHMMYLFVFFHLL